MQTIALHTRLKAGNEEQYERVHTVIPVKCGLAGE
ncbi:MAG: hypothetical protein JWP76_5869 [Dactylosporangium sp.]|jgi:hypothetical protein|nr:hypothetical protein [Dactylosporangium sp.]